MNLMISIDLFYCFQVSIDLYDHKSYCIDTNFNGNSIQIHGVLKCEGDVTNEAKNNYELVKYYTQASCYIYCMCYCPF